MSVLSDQWKGFARASVEQDDPIIPISKVDWSSMTSVIYDPLHAHPAVARRDRIRIFLTHLMSMDGRVFILHQRASRCFAASGRSNIVILIVLSGMLESHSAENHPGNLFLENVIQVVTLSSLRLHMFHLV